MHYMLMRGSEIAQIYVTKGLNPMPHWKDKGMGMVGDIMNLEFDTIMEAPDELIKIFDARRDGLLNEKEAEKALAEKGIDVMKLKRVKSKTGANFHMGTFYIINAQKKIQHALRDLGPLNVIDVINLGGENALAFIRMSLDETPYIVIINEGEVVHYDTPKAPGATSALDEVFWVFQEKEKEAENGEA